MAGLKEDILVMKYGFLKDEKIIRPIPRLTYATEPVYKNDTIAAIKYNIKLNGQLIINPDDPTVANFAAAMSSLNEVFSSNHKTLWIESYEKGIIFMANNILVKDINFLEGTSNLLKEIPYTVELESMSVLVGEGLDPSEMQQNLLGYQRQLTHNHMTSPYMQDLRNYSLQDWDEQFGISTAENQTARTVSVDRVCYYDDVPAICERKPLIIRTTLGGEFFNIQYSVTATGKQMAHNEGQNMMPGWQHAKRFCHTKFLQQMGGLFESFLSMNGNVPIELMGANAGNGAFQGFQTAEFPTVAAAPKYRLYNENFSVDVSESDQTFGITYNAVVMRNCPIETKIVNPRIAGLEDPEEYADYFCSDGVIHTVSKTVQKTMEANEYTKMDNQNTSITINGTITGMVPGAGLAQSKILFDATKSSARGLMVYNSLVGDGNNGPDKYAYASLAFDKIFDYNNYDLNPVFKNLFGINAYTLRVSPTSRLLPASISVVRNMIGGTIEYSATYSTKINCDPNNFEISLSTKQPTPVIAEFTIPNNNIRDTAGELCESGRGFNVIQLLGTTTPKTIDVSITASVANNFNKCCLGTDENWNMLDYDFFRLQSFALPSGMVIPYVSDKYALTKKSKSVTYPAGSMNFSLSYVCADFCEIEDYFNDVPFEVWSQNSLSYNELVTDPTIIPEQYYLDKFEGQNIQ